jgi:hypothetical protein
VHPLAVVAVSDGADDAVTERSEVERGELFPTDCPGVISEVPALEGEQVEREVGEQTIRARCPRGVERAHQDLEVRSVADQGNQLAVDHRLLRQ